MRTSLKYVFVVVMSGLMTGCMAPQPLQLYKGARLSPDQEVYISGYVRDHRRALSNNMVVITCVDNMPTEKVIGGYEDNYGRTYPNRVVLQAGLHYLDVLYLWERGRISGKFWVDTVVGHKYIVQMQEVSGEFAVRMWVEDAESHTPVGGIDVSPHPAVRRCPRLQQGCADGSDICW
jgi:hypothetical protein